MKAALAFWSAIVTNFAEKSTTHGSSLKHEAKCICAFYVGCACSYYTRSLDQMGPKGIHLNEPLGMCLDIFPPLKLPAAACMPFNPCDEMH